jgi:hypothetical protein
LFSGRHEIVILCGEHAENFDAEGHHPASSKDSIIQLFLGMTVAQFQVSEFQIATDTTNID